MTDRLRALRLLSAFWDRLHGKSDDADAESSNEPEPGLRFRDITIHFNFAFDVGGTVNPTAAARRLLSKDFATASANHVADTVEIADRFKQLLGLRNDLHRYTALDRAFTDRGLRGMLTWCLRHPRLGLPLLWKIMGFIRRQGDEDDSSDGENRPRASETLREGLEFVNSNMDRMIGFEGLQLQSDRSLFTNFYLDEAPFRRIALQPFFADSDYGHLAVDANVLVHRSGIALLTFYVVFDGEMTIDELIQATLTTRLGITHLELEQSIVDVQANIHHIRPSRFVEPPYESRYSSGVHWIKNLSQIG